MPLPTILAVLALLVVLLFLLLRLRRGKLPPVTTDPIARDERVEDRRDADAADVLLEESSKADTADADAPQDAALVSSPPEEEPLDAYRRGLASTRGGFISRLAGLFRGRKEIDPALLEDLEEVLLTADIGVHTADRILEQLKDKLARQELDNEERVWTALQDEGRQILDGPAKPLECAHSPTVILVVGVNGVGKTTTIGKLASRFAGEGKKVLLAAGDTYRAAAVLQLEAWGSRVGCPVSKGKENADPASVIFDAVKRARNEEFDLLIADTAGRLHTKSNLMEELKKVLRTTEKALERSVDHILLVLDATTGQNAIQQAEIFKDAIPVSGVVLTKLDGTAKGGVVLGIVDRHQVPIHFIGIGERVEDLREFDAKSFVHALFEKPEVPAATQ